MKRVALLTVALSIALLSLAATSAAGTVPGRSGAIVYAQRDTTFTHGPTGDSAAIARSIRVHEPSGVQRTLVSCTLLTDFLTSACSALTYVEPAVSPDGRLVAFGAGTRVGIVPIGGGRVRLLPQHSDLDRTPAFSPDGRRLVFTAVTHKQPSLMTCDLTCRRSRPLVIGGDSAVWSVRGWIAFVDGGSLYRIRPDGHGLKLLARGNLAAPSWSPDGRRLAVVQGATLRNSEVVRAAGVVVMDADGRHAHRLGGAARNSAPTDVAWSPDGRRLLVLDAMHRRLLELDARGRLLREDRWAFPPFDRTHVTSAGSVAWQPLR